MHVKLDARCYYQNAHNYPEIMRQGSSDEEEVGSEVVMGGDDEVCR